MSLTARILLGFFVISMVGLAVLLNPVIERVERQYLEAAEEPMVDFVNLLAELLRDEVVAGEVNARELAEVFERVRDRQPDARIYDVFKTEVDVELVITDDRGLLLFDSARPGLAGLDYSGYRDVRMTLAGGYGARATPAVAGDRRSTVMHVAAPVLDEDGRIAGVISLAKPQQGLLGFIHGTRVQVYTFAGVAALLMMLTGYLMARWISAPLRSLTDYAEAAARGERVGAPALPGHQLRRLGETMEHMRDALEGRHYAESYVRNLTHEMKSPMAAIRGAAELLEEDMPAEQRRRFLHNIRMESQRLQTLTDRLLALSSVENLRRLEKRDRIDLNELVRAVVEEQSRPAGEAGLRLVVEMPQRVEVHGEPFLLSMAVGNLLQNAIEFSPEGSDVRIGVVVDDKHVRLRVEDQGAGIPDYARERVFERFFSLPRPRGGRKSSGLGLCFVRETAQLHGGAIVLESLAPDVEGAAGGTRAELILPR